MRNMTETVKQLIIINFLFFAGTYLLGEPVYKILSLYFPENTHFKVWQPLSHMFMHGGFMHIFFNMFALYSFGTTLEQRWGSNKFLFFYISCGLGAALLHTGVNYYFFQSGIDALASNGFTKAEVLQLLQQGQVNSKWEEAMSPTAFYNFVSAYSGTAFGASGATYGVMVAFAFMFPNVEMLMMLVPIPIKAKYFVTAVLLLDLYSGIVGKSVLGGGSGIGHFAHIGGALVGFFMMWYWKKNQFNKNRWN
ncbi:rhomboid family intramembrane serine protease [Flavobacterium turcicum]|uniref:Rhomboid family intramembrane serine protease n=1 Tax=Flavobacterium turcicum TaxID=2764718 RepID=A0ABR7JGD5_9FLAO|nr:rhomboid family intramembrane serine protease [Flavobacterium turcicum]MBC5863532.1 rhomboid family intramembrane serine protease [Flavobacterium turcicum]NHL02518.1 rhomboid family intramembrane serine protease [Flavobacterium turcicum]